jgi:hypothetical protein
MNREDIIRMAREASADKDDQNIFFDLTVDELEAFAKLVAQYEREACAMVCELLSLEWEDQPEIAQVESATKLDCALAIRARGQA